MSTSTMYKHFASLPATVQRRATRFSLYIIQQIIRSGQRHRRAATLPRLAATVAPVIAVMILIADLDSVKLPCPVMMSPDSMCQQMFADAAAAADLPQCHQLLLL